MTQTEIQFAYAQEVLIVEYQTHGPCDSIRHRAVLHKELHYASSKNQLKEIQRGVQPHRSFISKDIL